MSHPSEMGGESVRDFDFFGKEWADYAKIYLDPQVISEKGRTEITSENWTRLYMAGVGLAFVHEAYDRRGISPFVIDESRPEIHVLRKLRQLDKQKLLVAGFAQGISDIANGSFEQHWQPFYSKIEAQDNE